MFCSRKVLQSTTPILSHYSFASSRINSLLLSRSFAMASATSFYEFKPQDKRGEPYDLAKLEGKVVLVVNTASKCGFTPQFKDLEELYKKLKTAHPDKFEILGFPCNQFGNQDPGTDDEIQSFCQVNYGVSFPVLKKINVNGGQADPLYEWMKKEKPGFAGLKVIKWNFEKFLIGSDGKVVNRWSSMKKPQEIESAIIKEIQRAASVETSQPTVAPAAETKA